MQVTSTIHLNAHQQRIIAQLVANGGVVGDPLTLHTTSNMRVARDTLIQIKAIAVSDQVTLTKLGMRLAVDEGLATTDGTMTDKGNQLLGRQLPESFALLRELLAG